MNALIRALGMVLALQLFITALVYWPRSTPVAANPGAALLPVEWDTIAEILLTDERGQEVLLQRRDGRWQLPGLLELPADQDQVRRLLHAITVQQHGYPVATSIAARQRFEVASYRFQRRIVLVAEEEQLGTVYLGTAPVFRRVHARRAAEDAIYSLAFTVFDAPAEDAAWLDRRLLQVAAPQAVRGTGFALQRQTGGNWLTDAGASPEPRELDALLVSLANLQVQGIADEDQQRTLAGLRPAFSLQIDTATEARTLAFFRLDDEYFVLDQRFGLFFTTSAYDFDRLDSLDAARLNGQ